MVIVVAIVLISGPLIAARGKVSIIVSNADVSEPCSIKKGFVMEHDSNIQMLVKRTDQVFNQLPADVNTT